MLNTAHLSKRPTRIAVFVLGALIVGCTPPKGAANLQASIESTRQDQAEVVRAPISSRFHGPWLLPRFERVAPRQWQSEVPDQAQLLVDGLRVELYADGHYALGAGFLPIGREVQIVTLPKRLGEGVVFVLSSEDDTWFFRASDFTSTLKPLGRLEHAVESVTPGFTALSLRLRTSGARVALDPNTGQLSNEFDVPESPEYGPFAATDEGFGAYVDPLRGLMVTRDAGGRYELFSPKNQPHVAPSQIEKIRAKGQGLEVTLVEQRRFLITQSGEVLSEEPVQRPKRAKVREQDASVKSWISRLSDSNTGGWPIEQALLRGVRMSANLAAYVNEGVLIYVTLDDGKVRERWGTAVPRDQMCFGAIAQQRKYFLCHDRTGTALYRFDEEKKLVALGYWTSQRSFGAVTDAGVILKGPCGTERAVSEGPQTYCGVSVSGKTLEFRVPNDQDRFLPLLIAERQAVVFELPSPTESGALHGFGTRHFSTLVQWPKPGLSPGLQQEGFFVREVTLQQGQLSGYLRRGDVIQGYRVTLDGQLRLGDLVTGAAAALMKGPFALVPDSSDYAYESLDGGMNWGRSRLPTTASSPLLALPTTIQQYGCSSVGCILGDWLRVGWSASAHKNTGPLPSQMETLESPARLTLEGRRRRMPRMTCQVTEPVARAHALGGGAASPGAFEGGTTKPRHLAARDPGFESTAWSAFFGVAAPQKAMAELGFDRGFRSERYSGRLYARIRNEEQVPSAKIDVRVFDALGAARPWSTRLQNQRFDHLETLARLFAHPRYGDKSVPLLTAFDVGGEHGLLVFDDAEFLSGYVLAANQPVQVLPELLGHSPKRITDFVSLNDAVYLLGTEPRVALFEIRGQEVRVLSDEDPRAFLSHARLRLVRDSDATRVGYLLSSIRLRSADVIWSLYPIDVATGQAQAPLKIPLDTGLRRCEADDDGWLVEAELDDVADANLLPNNIDIAGRGRALLLASEQGLCVKRVAFVGQLSAAKLVSRPSAPKPAGIGGRYLDTQGGARPLVCEMNP